MKKRRKKNKRKNSILIIILLVVIVLEVIAGFGIRNMTKAKIKLYNEENKKQEILSHYNQYVTTSDDAIIYNYDNNEYKKIGKISANEVLELVPMTVTYKDEYFKLAGFDSEYYIRYDDVMPISENIVYSDRYKVYIPFNQNVITKNNTSFYDEEGKLVYDINKDYDLPIIIKKSDMYGVEFNNRLLYIKKSDDTQIKDNHNTDLTNTKRIGTLNYHFFWDDEKESRNDCNQVICISKTEFKKHLDLFKEMNLLTITMKEAEMYIDGALQLPKSVLITIDDGWRAQVGIDTLREYKMYATLFLITGSYEAKWFTDTSEYIEIHSHTNKLHDGGKCPGGQGGGLKCLPRDVILSDLKTSREKLNGSTVLCYPFYEYNSYTIELVKEAGFTMAFAGERSNNNENYLKVGSYKYALPRFVIVTYTTMDLLKWYLS